MTEGILYPLIVGLICAVVGQSLAFILWVIKLDRRLYRMELKIGVEK